MGGMASSMRLTSVDQHRAGMSQRLGHFLFHLCGILDANASTTPKAPNVSRGGRSAIISRRAIRADMLASDSGIAQIGHVTAVSPSYRAKPNVKGRVAPGAMRNTGNPSAATAATLNKSMVLIDFGSPPLYLRRCGFCIAEMRRKHCTRARVHHICALKAGCVSEVRSGHGPL